jgi:hypothetical protein
MKLYNFSNNNSNTCVHINKCVHCKESNQFRLNFDHYQQWRSGVYVQDIFTHLSIDERELLISGTHPECWNEVFGEDDE